MLTRINKVRKKIGNSGLDACFISNQSNVTYLTGFTGLSPNEREAFLFVTLSQAYLLTFPTYFGLFEKGGDGFISLNITRSIRISDHLLEIIKREGINKIGFEKDNLTVSEFESLKTKLNAFFSPTENIVEEERLIKDDNEIIKIRRAAKITDKAFEYIKGKIKRGISEKDLGFELEFFLKKTAGDIAFTPIVAFNKNAAIPHYLPSDKRLTDNSLILLDFGARVLGYCADMTRVVFFGTPSSRQIKIYQTVLNSQEKALSVLKIGIAAKEIDKVAREYILSQGFPEYPHGLGHGVGLAIHEAPRLKKDSIEIFKENMVVTIEPGIYLDGDCGVRIEDLVLLTKDDYEVLSKSSKDITIL